jgi:hypothetical protein
MEELHTTAQIESHCFGMMRHFSTGDLRVPGDRVYETRANPIRESAIDLTRIPRDTRRDNAGLRFDSGSNQTNLRKFN